MSTIASVLPDVSKSDLYKINICRLHMRAMTVSDLADASGSRLKSSIFPNARTPPAPTCGSGYVWPTQPPPPSTFWKVWKSSLTRAFCVSNDLSLRDPLGDWIEEMSLTQPRWDWVCKCCQDGQHVGLYFFDQNKWHLHPVMPGRQHRLKRFLPVGIPTTMIHTEGSILFRASVRHRNHVIEITDLSAYRVRRPNGVPNHDAAVWPVQEAFLHYMSRLKESEWLFRTFRFKGDLTKLLNDFCNGDAITASNGSYSDSTKHATASWVIESADRTAKIEGDCVTPGTPDIQSSYRAELSGILGISASIWCLYQIALHRNIRLDRCDDVIIACDGYSALQKCFVGIIERMTCKHKHFDLIAAIRGLWNELPFIAFPTHVEGHKDEYYPYYALTRLEKMNVDMDHRAKQYLQLTCRNVHGAEYGAYTYGLPTITHNGVPILTEAYKTLTMRCTRRRLVEYWRHTWHMSEYEFHQIALDPLERAFASCSAKIWGSATRWLSNQVNLGTRVSLQSRKRKHPAGAMFRCPRCRSLKDDKTHVFRCPKARQTVQLHLDSLTEWMEQNTTDPDLAAGIILCTQKWLQNNHHMPHIFLSHLPHHIVDVLRQQLLFGWDKFLSGIHLHLLTDVQNAYFLQRNNRRSPAKWHGQLIVEIWKLLDAVYADRKSHLTQMDEDNDEDHPAVRSARVVAAKELELGIGTIPPLYHQYFAVTANALASKSVKEIRKWLYIVRLNREAMKDPLLIPDDQFSPQGKYRSWLSRP